MNVIYVLSNGRSGSTLVEMLLGADHKCFTLGEAHDLYWNLELGNTSGNGDLLSECPFWGNVISKISCKGTTKLISLFREGYGRGKVLRWKYLGWLFFEGCSNKHIDRLQPYIDVNELYFQLCIESTLHVQENVPTWLIDASKDPYRLMALSKSPSLNIKVVHIIKRPEAFVYSMTKSLERGHFLHSVRMAFRWCIENFIMFRVRKRFYPNNSSVTLSYEALATNPEYELKRLSNKLSLGLNVSEMMCFRDKRNFAISGNKMRGDGRPISLDERWRKELNPVLRIIIAGICYLPRKFFVYKYGFY